MLLGAGELGKEVTLELQRLGAEVIAVDRYANAPAMQVAQQAIVVDMFDAQALHQVITEVKPHLILPEVEAIATEVLTEVEQAGVQVAPTARAVQLTMDREGIRRLAAET
jgi:phosphoribosylglycinamide formyltransferase 2